MTTDPQTLTQPVLEPCDIDAWAAIEVDRPAVVLLSSGPHLSILLAKDVEEVHPPRTLLRGVRWVRVPTGWRGAALRMCARWLPVRLPAEWLFDAVALEDRPRDDMPHGVAHIANVTPDYERGLLLPDTGERHFPLKFLTHRQYHALASAKGRILHGRVTETFKDELRARRRRSRSLASMVPSFRRRRGRRLGPVFAG
jgi:hypothetical protein